MNQIKNEKKAASPTIKTETFNPNEVFLDKILSTYELVVKEHHLDTFGHVNNAVYLQLFEEARWEFIDQRGYGLNKVQAEQKGPVILEANIKFLKELKLRERIRITFETILVKPRIMVIKQQMLKNNGDVASELVITIGFFDLIERKLIPMTEDWLKATKSLDLTAESP